MTVVVQYTLDIGGRRSECRNSKGCGSPSHAKRALRRWSADSSGTVAVPVTVTGSVSAGGKQIELSRTCQAVWMMDWYVWIGIKLLAMRELHDSQCYGRSTNC